MRDKIVFFILGALVATIAYAVGNASKVDAYGVGTYELLVVDSLVTKKIYVSESGIRNTDDSFIGIAVEDNIPNIMVANRKFGIEQSGVMISAFSGLDEPGPIPTFMLNSEILKEQYVFTSKGVFKK